MLALLVAALVSGGALQDAATARAESLMAVGRAHFVRPVIGRYAALEAFRAAARLAPRDPEPLYWQMKVGFYLGSDEGDALAREAILRIFALEPDYEDVWERFQTLYRSPGIWRRAERALARHPDDPVALERRGELLLALDEPARADSLLAVAMARRPATVATYLRRAEASFLAGRDPAGYAWHDSAVARANADSTGALWDEAWIIASPEETARHAATAPGERRRFFEWFWARRDPNLVTPENERLGEQYRRRAEARRMYRLLHPQRMVYRSSMARALASADARAQLDSLALQTPEVIPGGVSTPGAAASRVATVDLRTLQDAALPVAYRAGFDARGLVFLRHGPPDLRVACIPDPRRPFALPDCSSSLDAEGWLYQTPDGPLTVSFSWRGEYFAPVSRGQVRTTEALLHSDRTALPAPLVLRGWSAFFKSAELGRTDVYFQSAPDTAAAVLWDMTGDETVRVHGPGLLTLTVPPGEYEYGFDADSNGVVGRLRGRVIVPAFSAVDLGLSSLALAPAAALLDREATLRGMPADLAYPANTPLAAYVEVYGLTTDRDGRSRYRVRYSFAPLPSGLGRLLGRGRPVVLEFGRDVAASRTAERLVIQPDQLPAGRYRVTVAVTDLRRNVKSESAALDITIR
ncbi:MAG TPA: hypothetical protein VGQ25_12975 [Gemmatimonadales bacterium]|jgi:hypothetical protein|nr:hypothetical protein [Gemmatimonadales bacterium]